MSTDAAILEAALEQFALTGVRRTSTDDIAQRAGVNRATLYRRFGSREQLVHAAFLHEAGRVLAAIDAEVGPIPSPDAAEDFDPADWIARFFSVSVRTLRRHPVLQQMLEVDRHHVLVGMTVDAGGTLALAATAAADNIRALRAHLPQPLPDDDIPALGATFARLAQSLVLTPDGPPRLGSAGAMRRYAERVVVPLILGRT